MHSDDFAEFYDAWSEGRKPAWSGTMNEIINSAELPAPSGFSHAVKAGNTVYLAGQIGAGTTLAEQFDDAAANLITALKAAGGSPEDLVTPPGLRHRRRRVPRVPDGARPGVAQALRPALSGDGPVRCNRTGSPGSQGRADGHRGPRTMSPADAALDLHLTAHEQRELYDETRELARQTLTADRRQAASPVASTAR